MTDLFRTYYDAARALYPLLPQWYELTSDGINPEFRGLNAGGLPIFNVPANYTLMPDEPPHEAGHAYLKLLESTSRDYLADYWDFRGFPGTWHDALTESNATTGNAAWQLDPRESWAEAFARSVVPTHAEKTMTYGKDRTAEELRAFFQSLNPSAIATVIPAPILPSLVVTQKDPVIEWLGPAADSNYLVGRQGQSIALIVDHWIGAGTFDQALAHFQSPTAIVSAHYIVGTDGRIGQVVKDEDTAYHAGAWMTNVRSIGIEHEATPDLAPSEALYAASAWLHAQLAAKHNLVLNVGATVLRHRNIVATQCPGTLSVERIVALSKGGDSPVTDAEFLEKFTRLVQPSITATDEAIKARLAIDAHHRHGVSISTISEDTTEPK